MVYIEQWGGGIVRTVMSLASPPSVEYGPVGRVKPVERIETTYCDHPDYWVAGCPCGFCREWQRRDYVGKQSLLALGHHRYTQMAHKERRYREQEYRGTPVGRQREVVRRKELSRIDREIARNHQLAQLGVLEKYQPTQQPKPVAKRPTYMEVVDRDSEIVNWGLNQAKDLAKFHRRLRLYRWLTALSAVLACIILLFGGDVAWLVIPWAVLGITAVVGSMALIHAGGVLEGIKSRRPPSPLEIIKYSDGENKQLLDEQEPEQFQALCSCPSCGYWDQHELVPGDGAPDWVEVLRSCKFCGRQWGQK